MPQAIATFGYRYGGQDDVGRDQLEDSARRLVEGITSEEFEAPDNEHVQAYVTRPDGMSMTVYVDGLVVVQHLEKAAKAYRRADSPEAMIQWIVAFAGETLKTAPGDGWVRSLDAVSSVPTEPFRPCSWGGELALLQAEHGEGAALLEAVFEFVSHSDYASHAQAWIDKHGLVVNVDDEGPAALSRLLTHERDEVRWRGAELLVRAYKARKAKRQDALLPALRAALAADDDRVVRAVTSVEFKRKQASPELIEVLLALKRGGSSSAIVTENLIRFFDWKRPKDPAIVEVAEALLAADDRWSRHLVRQQIENRTLLHGKGPIRDALEGLYRAAPEDTQA